MKYNIANQLNRIVVLWLALILVLLFALSGCASKPVQLSDATQTKLIAAVPNAGLITAAKETQEEGNECQKELLEDKSWYTRATSLVLGCNKQTDAAVKILCLAVSQGLPSLVKVCMESGESLLDRLL